MNGDSIPSDNANPICAIIGAGEGLGKSLAVEFATHGHDIALVSRSQAGSDAALSAALEVTPRIDARFFAADATQPRSVETALQLVAQNMGEVEVLIYNARDSFKGCAPLDLEYEALEQTLRLEVVGALAAAKAVLPSMRRRGHGSLMYSSATAAFRGSAINPAYAIGKFALRALSQSLSKAYAVDGIHVVHFRIDCDLDVPIMRQYYQGSDAPDILADPDAIAKSYWAAHQQPPQAWSNEIELRPLTEKWTY